MSKSIAMMATTLPKKWGDPTPALARQGNLQPAQMSCQCRASWPGPKALSQIVPGAFNITSLPGIQGRLRHAKVAFS